MNGKKHPSDSACAGLEGHFFAGAEIVTVL